MCVQSEDGKATVQDSGWETYWGKKVEVYIYITINKHTDTEFKYRQTKELPLLKTHSFVRLDWSYPKI